MLTSFQQFLATCIGKTEEEAHQPTDAQDSDKPQTELKLTVDANSSDDTETIASSIADTEIRKSDASSALEKAPLEPERALTEDEAEPPITENSNDNLESTKIQAQETEVSDHTKAESERTLEPIPLILGVAQELYDFVDMFEHSTVSGAEQAAANGIDCSGGIQKPAIFEHPAPTETAKINYTLSLPETDSKDQLLLHFFIGLRDGVAFDDTERQPGGVKFALEIANSGETDPPERRFESVATECCWQEKSVNLTDYAGKNIVISFLTECNTPGNSNYAWALWGKPELYKLEEKPLRKAKRGAEPEARCGIAIVHFDDEKTQSLVFNQSVSTPVTALTDICIQTLDIKEPPAKISIYVLQPKLEIVSIGSTAAVVSAGEDFEIQCTLRNSGDAPLDKRNIARITINGARLRRGRPRQNVKHIEPGEKVNIQWSIRSLPRPTVHPFSVLLIYQTALGEKRQTAQGKVTVLPSVPKLTTKVVKELHTYSQNGSVVLGNKHLRIVFVRSIQPTTSNENPDESRFQYYMIFVAKGRNYQRVATSPALSEVVYLDELQNRQTFQLVPTRYQLAGNNDESIVRLSGTNTDTDGVKWDYEMEWTLTEEATRVKTEYRLKTNADRGLLAFRGPTLYAGCGHNPEKKTAALFPGLEFLEDEEHSSNPRDAFPPLNNRLVPHPYKITVPVMAVEMQKAVVGIIWNPLDTWDSENHMLSAIFASPNWHQHQKNHILGLFLPTTPEWVQENETEASTPYPLTASREISIKCEIIANGNASILDAVSHWTDAYGAPKPLEPPRTDEEELLLSRHGLMHVTWDKIARKSRHCVGWKAHNEPGFGTLLWYDYLATKNKKVKERALEIAENTITESGKEGLAARGSCHILSWEFPFYIGNIDAALTYMQKEAQQRIATQQSDGSWRWQTNGKTASLGKTGDAVLGTCAESALLLLKHARITGNKTSQIAGVKALKFMKQFSLPRGAQMWECPMYQPDVLAAAHAIAAYVEAYELTTEKEYLKRANYWAETTLPFLYHWHLPDRPGMQFASIPVFGTSFYTHPWFGVPVQWNGLVLAYYLQRLNQHTKDERWLQIAEGITVSAMHQQWADGEFKGTYPDGFYGFCTEGRGPHLNPENIMVNIYTLRGLDPGIKTAIAGEIHISSGAKINALTLTDAGRLKWQLSYATNEASYALIVGYQSTPKALRVRYQLSSSTRPAQNPESNAASDAPEQVNARSTYAEIEVPAAQTLEDVESGWLYIEDQGVILVKYLHTATDVQFELV